MIRNLGCLLAAAMVVALASLTFDSPALSQDGMLDELYGRGVHAYFNHDYRSAHGLLSSAITSGTRDPRAYYFRGLANNRLGRPDEAKSDFHKGAELEAMGGEPYPVARSLELPRGAAIALFAIGRTIGWIAHAIEQYGQATMIRPRAKYVGPKP